MNAANAKLLSIVGGAGAVYLGLAVLMGVLPGAWLSRTPPGPGVKPLTAEEDLGREVYVSEGCSYCHTQQVRPLSTDAPFGRPSAPGDFAYQTPELLGSERNGPDLANIGARQPSTVWQYMHLYQPRSVVPQSIMPAFPWLFRVVDRLPPGETAVPIPKAYAPEHGFVIPTQRGKALVAYLLSLKQPPLPEQEKALALTAPAAPAASAAANAPAPAGANAAAGAKLFADRCAVCHGATGEGVPGAFPSLKGDPVVNAANAKEQIRTVLFGLQGKKIGDTSYSAAMPPFADQLSDDDIMQIINHERSSWGNHAPLITAKDVAAERSSKP